jgi:hypothetical protein
MVEAAEEALAKAPTLAVCTGASPVNTKLT